MYTPNNQIDTAKCIQTLAATPAGQKALAALLENLLDHGMEVSEERPPEGQMEQAKAYTDLVIQAILYGQYEQVANELKGAVRSGLGG
jgi:hypothetical protein